MINAIERARDLLTDVLPVGINHYGRKARVYAVLRQVDQWFQRSDNRNSMQYDLIQVDVWAADGPDYGMDKRVRDALEAAGFKLCRTGGDSDSVDGVMLHRISHDYQFDQEYEEV